MQSTVDDTKGEGEGSDAQITNWLRENRLSQFKDKFTELEIVIDDLLLIKKEQIELIPYIFS